MKKNLFVLSILTFLIGCIFVILKIFPRDTQKDATKVRERETPKVITTKAASEKIDYHQLYQEGISAGAIDSNTLSYEQWVKENEEEFIPVYKKYLNETKGAEKVDYHQLYQENIYAGAINPKTTSFEQWVKGLDKPIFDTPLSYAAWIKLNHYGQPPN